MNKKKKKGRLKKIIAFVIVAVIAVVLVGMNFARGKKEETIKTTKVKLGDVVEKLTETGNIELLRTVEVKSKIAGTVSDIMVKEGDEVVEGQPLCVIDPDPNQTLLLLQKRAGVDRTRINMEQAKKELNRKRELAKTSYVSDKEVEDAENAFLISQNAYNLARQELVIMEREIETSGAGSDERIVASTVKAPYTGYITQRYVEEGDIVTSGMSSIVAGTNLFQIGDPSTKIIKANISEVDISKVENGATVNIMLDAYPDTSFAGLIRHISPVGTLQQGRNVVTFKTEVEIIDEDSRLRPGMSCDVDVIINEADNVMFLPIESVFEKKTNPDDENDKTKQNIIYVKKNGESNSDGEKKAKKRKGLFAKKVDLYEGFDEITVECGIRSESRVQVIADIDTSSVVASDAEGFFKELEKREKEKKDKDKNDDKSETDESDETEVSEVLPSTNRDSIHMTLFLSTKLTA